MCIPIELDVPVLTLDQDEVGTAREILCSCPADGAPDAGVVARSGDSLGSGGDLWLRVERVGRPDLFIPFGEILETRPDGVRLRTRHDDLGSRFWERPPNGVALPFAIV